MQFLKVAKGVGGFIAGSDVGRSESQRIEGLLQRIADGPLAEERQDAVSELRDALHGNPEAQQAVGSAFPVLINALKTERGDLEMMRGVLESLALAVQSNERSARFQGADPAAINAELLAKNEELVPLLFGFLKDGPQAASDFYVRYHTLQLLTALAAGGPYRLQRAILAAPMGVVQLMDLLGDSREVIRNEAVLLLTSLTKASPDIQKIAAFEGAFEHILHILEEEDWALGGIIVQDCLDLLSHLVQNNIGNQLMFREVGHMSRFIRVLQLPPEKHRRNLPRQVGANIVAAIVAVQQLCSPAASSPAGQDDKQQQECALANRAALAKLGALDALLTLAVGGGGLPSGPVRTQALVCIAKLIKGFPPHQGKLGGAHVTAANGASIPALQAILQVALTANDPAEATAGAGVIASFCEEYQEGQLMLAATFAPPPSPSNQQQGNRPGTFGSDLAAALTGLRPSPVARAAGLLHHVLLGNPECKRKVLEATSSGGTGSEGSLLLRCCRQLSNMLASGQQGEPPVSLAVMMLLRLLMTWVHECPPAQEALLALPGHLPMLLELTQKRFGERTAVVNGLSAALLGVCATELRQPVTCQSQDPSASPERISASTILEVIGSRIGMASYFGRLDALLQQPEFAQPAGKGLGSDSTSGDQAKAPHGVQSAPSIFDAKYVRWLSQLKGSMHKLAMNDLRRPSADGMPEADANMLQQSEDGQDKVAALEREVSALKVRLQQALEDRERSSEPPSSPAAQQELAAAKARADKAEAVSSRHLQEIAALKGRLQQAEQEAGRWRTTAAQAQAAADKSEADMEGLGNAYNMLEAHSHDLESRIQELESTGASSRREGGEHAHAPRQDEEEGEEASGLDDLLVCLGQEEQKVAILGARLEELGVDWESLLEAAGDSAG